MPTDDPCGISAFRRISDEIARLTRIQIDDLERAAFVPLSPDEAQEHDDRITQIMELQRELASLLATDAARESRPADEQETRESA